MIEVKTAELIGPALDWAVGIAAGGEQKPYQFADNIDAPFWDAWVFPYGYACSRWSPSTDWAQGGRLIERFGCDLSCIAPDNCWEANCWDCDLPVPGLHLHEADTPLVAAMRAIVASNLGDAVSVPAELVQQPTEGSGDE